MDMDKKEQIKEENLAFSTGFKNPDRSPEDIRSNAFKRLNVHNAKESFKEGQKKRKEKMKDTSIDTKNL